MQNHSILHFKNHFCPISPFPLKIRIIGGYWRIPSCGFRLVRQIQPTKSGGPGELDDPAWESCFSK